MSAGINPADDFRGRPLVDPRDKAGGWPRWRRWLKFETGQLGWPGQLLKSHAFRDSESDPITSWVPAHVPGLNALVGVTDAGFREQQRQAEHNVENEKAKLKAGYGSRTRQVEKTSSRYRGRRAMPRPHLPGHGSTGAVKLLVAELDLGDQRRPTGWRVHGVMECASHRFVPRHGLLH